MAAALGVLKKSIQDRPPKNRYSSTSLDHEPSLSSTAAALAIQNSVSSPVEAVLGNATNSSDASQSSPAESPGARPNTGTPPLLVARKSLRLSRGTTISAQIDNSWPLPNTVTPALSSSPGNSSSIDPLSQHIFMRTADLSKSSKLRNSRPDSPVPDALSTPNADATTKNNSLAADAGKKKGFLGRLSMRGNKKKDEASDNISESGEPRMEGSNARVFASIADAGGFMPHHKEPPRYIRVKACDKKTREFDRMFLAQELIGTRPLDQNPNDKIPLVTISTSSQVRKRAATGGAVWTTEFSKDGKYLAAGGRGHVVRVWAVISTPDDRRAQEEEEAENGGSGERLSAPVFLEKPVREFDGHTGDILDLSWSKNNFLLSTAMDKTVRLWHISRQECLCTFKHKELVSKVAFHPKDDRFFLAGCLDAVLRLWSIPDKSIAYSAQLPDMITAVAFSPDGKVSIAGLLNSYCHFFDTEGLKAQSQMHVRSSRGRNAKGSKITGIVTMVPPGSKDGDAKVLITSTDSRARVYSLHDKTLEAKLKGHEHGTTQLCASFSDDGKYVICGSEDRKAFVWSLNVADSTSKDKRPCEFFDAHSEMVTTAIFAPTTTRQLLGSSGDPIYDLCNPPPVTLMAVGESMASQSGLSDQTLQQDDGTRSVAPIKSRPEETPGYIARSTHYDGNIIVTSDDTGIIKVFRQDCAANKRKHESWETGSSFSRKLTASGLLGRSGSIIARNSMSGTTRSRRGSLSQPQVPTPLQAGDSDRILSWRQDIESNSRPSSLVGTPTRSERSISPSKVARTPASEARKQPYANVSLPLSTKSTANQTLDQMASSSPGPPQRANRSMDKNRVLEETASSDDMAVKTTLHTPISRSILHGRRSGDRVDTTDRSFGPPAPSFSFKALEPDTIGAGYSFWNLNKWKGIAGLRASITGSGSLGSERSGRTTLAMPTSPLAKSLMTTDGNGSSIQDNSPTGAMATAEVVRVRQHRQSTASDYLTPVPTGTSTSDGTATSDHDRGSSFLDPHAPVLAGELSPFTRGSSVVSQLSSELSSENDTEDDQTDSVEMQCAKCGGREFKARRSGGQQLLHCSRCGKAVDDEGAVAGKVAN